jgi:hypothetical protein
MAKAAAISESNIQRIIGKSGASHRKKNQTVS